MNVTLPVVLVILFGYILRRLGMLSDGFLDSGSKLVFDIAYPCSMFTSIAASDIREVWNGRLIAFFLISLVIAYVVFMSVFPRFIKDNKKAASVVQGILRINFLLQATPMAVNMYGTAGAAPVYLLLPFSIAMNTVASYIVFLVIPPEKSAGNVDIWKILKAFAGIFTNPLVIACFLGGVAGYLEYRPPMAIWGVLENVGRLAGPLALILLGAQFSFSNIRSNLKYTLPGTICRLIIMPVAITLAAIAMGFRGAELGCLFVLNSASSASISFLMAKRMGGDPDVAAQMVGLTSAFSGVTVFIGVFILKSQGLI